MWKVTGSEPAGLVPSRAVAGRPAAVATGSGPPASRTGPGLPPAVPDPMTLLRATGPSLLIVSGPAGGFGCPAVNSSPGRATATAVTTATAAAPARRRRLRMARPQATIAAAGTGPAAIVASARST